jgi:alpha-mannosidase
MKFQELVILLPCHSLEDFPQHHEGDEAAGLLAAWTALWHPALIASADAAPTWSRVDETPEDLTDRLLIVPSVSGSELPTGFAQRAESEGACLIRDQTDRARIVAAALERLDGGDRGIDPELAADFHALGYGFLQIQLLTRQMRYSSNLDEYHFNTQLVAGAQAAANGETALAIEKLTACFDLLGEERDHFYSVDAFLIDITMVESSTLGESMRANMDSATPGNFMIRGELLEQLAERSPETLQALSTALAAGTTGLIGGEDFESRLPLLSQESVLGTLRRGKLLYEQRLNHLPTVFGRRRFGLTPCLPQVLCKLGFAGAFHVTLDDGRFPQGAQVKTRWEGTDGSAIDSIAKVPLDAAKPETFLGLAQKLGESMDMDHVASICLAHWPGPDSVWLADLKRCAKYGSALGKFATVDAYFCDTYMPGQLDRFEASQYRSPYLKQSIIQRQSDPISTIQRYWQRRFSWDAASHLRALSHMITGDAPSVEPDLAATIDRLTESLPPAVGQEASETAGQTPVADPIDETLENSLSQALEGFAGCLPPQDKPNEKGYLVANPFNHTRRMLIDVSELDRLPEAAKPVYAVGELDGCKLAVVDVPSMGFAWLSASATKRTAKQSIPAMVEESDGAILLRNDFFEASINPTTGALQSMQDYKKRGNRISYQLALRSPGSQQQPGEAWRDPEEAAVYSIMVAESVDLRTIPGTQGEILVRGKLVDRKGELLARFSQTYRAIRGSRVLELDIELDPQDEPAADPWNSYYAARFAWKYEEAELFYDCQQTRHPVGQRRIEACQFIDIDTGDARTTLLTGGLPYHRRAGHRMLDSLLIVRGERARKFRLGIGVELANPVNDAVALLSPPLSVLRTVPPPAPATSSWLFHFDAKSLLATHWEPLCEEGRVVGFRVRVLETSGKATRAKIRGFRQVSAAKHINFVGEAIGDLQVENGIVCLEMTGHEWVEVEARFAT